MPASFEPIKAFRCTFPGCAFSFDTEKQMISHKKTDPEHDYCSKCKLDFESYEDLARHKAFTPDKHYKACRVCGEEFKSTSGLKRHTELAHRVKQQLTCVGCGEQFHSPALLVEHLEFGNCEVISADAFMGHVVHKHLISKLLDGGEAHDRFMQKISHYDAALDQEESGGVSLGSVLEEGNERTQAFGHPAIQPEVAQDKASRNEQWPALSQDLNASDVSSITSGMDRVSLGYTVADTSSRTANAPLTVDSKHQPKAWGGRSAKELFPKAEPTPAPASTEFSIEALDQQNNIDHGGNIFKTRFWDPLSGDWDPERFFNCLVEQYFCPFMCERMFPNVSAMRDHVLVDHRLAKAKCPWCLKYYESLTALMTHCQSRGSRCQVNKAYDFGEFINRVTGGFLSVEEKVRPDYIQNETVQVWNEDMQEMEPYTPPTVTYLEYSATKPMDWKEPTRVAGQIGGGNMSGTFRYKNEQGRW